MAILGIFGGMLMIFIPIAIVGLIVGAAVNKEKGNDSAKFSLSIKAVYTYVIIIITLFIIIFGSITAVDSLLDYIWPESEVETTTNCNTSNFDKVCSMESKELKIKNEKNRGITDFATYLSLVAVSVPIFIYHSKIAKSLREEKNK